MSTKTTVAERLWAKVSKSPDEHGCWEWQGACVTNGYGQMHANGRKRSTHRLAWELEHGPIPSGMKIDHICGNRKCLRPNHLRLVTHAENLQNLTTIRTDNTTGHRGANRNGGRFRARVTHNGRQYCCGTYDTAEQAGEAARLKRLELFEYNDLDGDL